MIEGAFTLPRHTAHSLAGSGLCVTEAQPLYPSGDKLQSIDAIVSNILSDQNPNGCIIQ